MWPCEQLCGDCLAQAQQFRYYDDASVMDRHVKKFIECVLYQESSWNYILSFLPVSPSLELKLCT